MKKNNEYSFETYHRSLTHEKKILHAHTTMIYEYTKLRRLNYTVDTKVHVVVSQSAEAKVCEKLLA